MKLEHPITGKPILSYVQNPERFVFVPVREPQKRPCVIIPLSHWMARFLKRLGIQVLT